jgi:XrtJ-associated TM-motif-TM protein
MNKLAHFSQSRVFRMALLAITVLAVSAVAHAQTGCDDSPEDPTVILAFVGSAGAIFSMIRTRAKARRNSSGR